MLHSSHISLALLTVIVVAMGGCGPVTGTVSGTVTVDGKPAATGVISFIPADNTKAPPVTAEIKAGQYSAEAKTGPKIVQISVPVVTGQRKEYNGPDAPLVDITEESVPARYNSETELVFEVKRGSNQKDWSVESVKGKSR
jgi:hypothetical protein